MRYFLFLSLFLISCTTIQKVACHGPYLQIIKPLSEPKLIHNRIEVLVPNRHALAKVEGALDSYFISKKYSKIIGTGDKSCQNYLVKDKDPDYEILRDQSSNCRPLSRSICYKKAAADQAVRANRSTSAGSATFCVLDQIEEHYYLSGNWSIFLPEADNFLKEIKIDYLNVTSYLNKQLGDSDIVAAKLELKEVAWRNPSERNCPVK